MTVSDAVKSRDGHFSVVDQGFDNVLASQNMTGRINYTQLPNPALPSLNQSLPDFNQISNFSGARITGISTHPSKPIEAEYNGRPFNVYLESGKNTELQFNAQADGSGFEVTAVNAQGNPAKEYGHIFSHKSNNYYPFQWIHNTISSGSSAKMLVEAPIQGYPDVPVKIKNDSFSHLTMEADAGWINFRTGDAPNSGEYSQGSFQSASLGNGIVSNAENSDGLVGIFDFDGQPPAGAIFGLENIEGSHQSNPPVFPASGSNRSSDLSTHFGEEPVYPVRNVEEHDGEPASPGVRDDSDNAASEASSDSQDSMGSQAGIMERIDSGLEGNNKHGRTDDSDDDGAPPSKRVAFEETTIHQRQTW